MNVPKIDGNEIILGEIYENFVKPINIGIANNRKDIDDVIWIKVLFLIIFPRVQTLWIPYRVYPGGLTIHRLFWWLYLSKFILIVLPVYIFCPNGLAYLSS